jgi:ankyrin repeat protein
MQLPKTSHASSSTSPLTQTHLLTPSAPSDLPITAGSGDLSITAGTGNRTATLLANDIPHLLSLPPEVLWGIFLECTHADALALARTCSTTASAYLSFNQQGAIGWRLFENECLVLINKDHLDDAEKTTLAHYYQMVLSRLFTQTISDADLKKTAALAEKFFKHLSFMKITELLGGVFNRVVSRHPQPIIGYFFDKLLSRQSWPNVLQPIFKKLADINLHLCITLMAISPLPWPRGARFPFPANYRFLLDKFPLEQRTRVEQFLDHLRQTQGNTAIQCAIDLEFLEIIPPFLKDNPHCIDILDKGGWTALMHANKKGCLDTVHLLLKLGAKMNLQNKNGWTALMIASQQGHLDTVRLLLKHSAELNRQSKDGWTALMIASQNGHLDMVRLLLKHSAEVNRQDEDGWTALTYASSKGHLDIVRLLLKHGAEVDLQDKDGWTALMLASKKNHLDTVHLLLAHKAEVNRQNENDWTALMLASQQGHLDTVCLLLEYKAEVNRQSKRGTNALMAAGEEGHLDTVRLLLEHSAEVNMQNENGWTALIDASDDGHLGIVHLLLEHKAEVNHQCNEGNTPLIYATMSGNIEIVRALLEQGAVTTIKNKSGNDALSLTQQYQHIRITVLLQRISFLLSNRNRTIV